MIICAIDANLILAIPFKNMKKELTKKSVMKKKMNKKGFVVDVCMLDNGDPTMRTDVIEYFDHQWLRF